MKNGVLIILSFGVISHAQIQIAGEQDGVFDSAIYVVTKDIIVQEGEKLEFLPGSRILFMPYTGVKVYGQLKLKRNKLISSDTAEGSWNGIDVISDGTLYFNEVNIARSILGIGVPDSSSLMCFKNVTFTSNKSTLRIAGAPVFIRDGISYSLEENQDTKPLPIHKDIYSGNDREVTLIPEKNSVVKPLRWVSMAATVACAALSVYCSLESVSYHKAYDSAKENSVIQFNCNENAKVNKTLV